MCAEIWPLISKGADLDSTAKRIMIGTTKVLTIETKRRVEDFGEFLFIVFIVRNNQACTSRVKHNFRAFVERSPLSCLELETVLPNADFVIEGYNHHHRCA